MSQVYNSQPSRGQANPGKPRQQQAAAGSSRQQQADAGTQFHSSQYRQDAAPALPDDVRSGAYESRRTHLPK